MIVGTQQFYAGPTKLTAQGAADVACPAGAFTTALSVGGTSTAIVSQSPGIVIPYIAGVLIILCGAAAPTALTIGFATTSGTEIDTLVVAPALLVNNATIAIPLALIGLAAATAWLGSGLTPLLEVNPTTNAVTAKAAGSRGMFMLLPGGA